MKENLTSSEWELQKLIDVKSFNKLTASEKSLVLGLISKEEYNRRRTVIKTAKNDKVNIAPLPLIIASKQRTLTIPIYQAVIAVAAIALVAFFIPYSYSDLGTIVQKEKIKYVSITDTVREIKYIHDTILKEVEKTNTIVEKVYLPKQEALYVNKNVNQVEPNEVLNAPNFYSKPNLNSLISEPNGSEVLAEADEGELFKLKIYQD